MSTFFLGGVLGDAKVKIKRARTDDEVTVRMDEVEDGDFVEGTSRWLWQVEEMRIVRRTLKALTITLDTGEKLTCAEGTVLAGVAGVNVLSENTETPTVFFARHITHGAKDDRRRFFMHLYGKAKAPAALLRHFDKAERAKGIPEKKYYFIDDAYRALFRMKKAFEHDVDFVTGVLVEPSRYADTPALKVRLNTPRSLRAFDGAPFPFFRVGDPTEAPVAIATRTVLRHFTFGKVVSLEESETAGPWYCPAFTHDTQSLRDIRDGRLRDRAQKTYNPLSVVVGGIPIFTPDDFIRSDVFEATASTEPLFSASEPERAGCRIYSVDDVFLHAERQGDSPRLTAADYGRQIFEICANAKAHGYDADAVVAAMEKIVDRKTANPRQGEPVGAPA